MDGTWAEIYGEAQRRLRALFFPDRGPMPMLGAVVLIEGEPLPGGEALRVCRDAAARLSGELGGAGDGLLPLLTAFAAVSPDPEAWLLRIRRAFFALRDRFYASPYVLLAALALEAGSPEESGFAPLTDQARAIYTVMSDHRPFLTGYDDIAACVLLAGAGRDPDGAAALLERCAAARGVGTHRNAAQALSHVLALTEKPEEACGRLAGLRDALRRNRCAPGGGYRAVLGILAELDMPPDEVALRVRSLMHILRRREECSPLVMSRSAVAVAAAFLLAKEAGASHTARLAALLALSAAETVDDLSGLLRPAPDPEA